MELFDKMLAVLDALGAIEKAKTEEDAILEALSALASLEYPDAMVSLLRNIAGEEFVVADPRFVLGEGLVKVAEVTNRKFAGGTDLLPKVLQRRVARFIQDSRNDPTGENDTDICRDVNLVSQYAIPLLTETMLIGTLQIAMGELDSQPVNETRMLDALAVHLSLAIERHRIIASYESLHQAIINQARVEAFDAAAAKILHGLNHSLRDYVRDLNRALKNDEDAKQFLLSTRKRIGNWSQIVEESVSSVRAKEYREIIDIEHITKEVIGEWCNFAYARGARLCGHYEMVKSARVYARRSSVREILSCLVTNAIEAHARKVSITLNLVERQNSEGSEQEYVEIVVADDGTGIAPEIKEKLGEFGWTTKIKSGHGLGLTLVDMLAKGIGGQFALRTLGKAAGEDWTEFVVYLPVSHTLGS